MIRCCAIKPYWKHIIPRRQSQLSLHNILPFSGQLDTSLSLSPRKHILLSVFPQACCLLSCKLHPLSSRPWVSNAFPCLLCSEALLSFCCLPLCALSLMPLCSAGKEWVVCPEQEHSEGHPQHSSTQQHCACINWTPLKCVYHSPASQKTTLTTNRILNFVVALFQK